MKSNKKTAKFRIEFVKKTLTKKTAPEPAPARAAAWSRPSRGPSTRRSSGRRPGPDANDCDVWSEVVFHNCLLLSFLRERRAQAMVRSEQRPALKPATEAKGREAVEARGYRED